MSYFRYFARYGVRIAAALGTLPVAAYVSNTYLWKKAECGAPISVRDARRKYPASEDYPDLSRHTNIMAKCLTPRIYAMLRDRITKNGVTLDQCIQVGVDHAFINPRIRTVGAFAGDEESYILFADLFDKIIEERHGGYTSSNEHPTDLDPSKLRGGVLDPDFVVSCRIRTCRNVHGFCFPPAVTRAERRHLERIFVQAFRSFPGDLKGRYYPIKSLSDDELALLIADNLAFDRPIAYYCSTTTARDWPDARGTFINHDRNLAIFVCECEEHLKVVSLQSGGNMKECFERFCTALDLMEKNIKIQGFKWMWTRNLGFLTSCPSNLGTALRASIFIRLPYLSKDSRFSAILQTLKLHKHAVNESDEPGLFDISNSERLGKSEVELVQTVIDSCHLLIKMEKRLRSSRPIDHLVPV